MKKRKVSEPTPVQAYLAPDEYKVLEQLAEQLGTSKSDVIRRGIRAIERELIDPDRHPALRLIGITEREKGRARRVDVAREHDRTLADLEEKSWRKSAGRRRHRGS